MILSRRFLLLGAIPLLSGAAERVPVSAVPVSRLDTPWWRARHEEKLAELRGRPVNLLWIGDSITQDWERRGPPAWQDFAPVWQHFYGDRGAVNLGFKGDNTGHLLWRLRNGEIDGISPKAAVLLIGANNMGRVRWSPPQTVAGIAAVLDELRRRLPDTQVLLLGILPSVRSEWVTRTTAEVNRELAARYGDGQVPGVTYVDASALYLLPDGHVDRTQFYDIQYTPPEPPLHPTAQAHERLAELIEPTLARMLGDRSKVGG